jgi:integrase
MGRPSSSTVTVKHDPKRSAQTPWVCRWRETDARTGQRRDAAQCFATEAEALSFKAEREGDAAALPALPPPKVSAAPIGPLPLAAHRRGALTFTLWAAQWTREYVSRKKPSTRRSYEGILETHLLPELGHLRLSGETFGLEQIMSMVANRTAAGASWGTQKAILRVLSTCLRWAVKYRHLPANPCAKLVKDLKDESKGEYTDPEANPLSAEQAAAFLAWLETGRAMADQPVDGPRLRNGKIRAAGFAEWLPYFTILLQTGMRRGEAAGLRWDTVFLDATPPRARLERNYSPSAKREAALDKRASDGDITLKSKRAREIDLSPDVVGILRELARTRRAEALKANRKLSPYVLVTSRGARMLSDSAQAERIFERGMQAIGAADAGHTIHDLRDTFATLHLKRDPSRLYWVAWMLGHRQRSTTLNRYTRWVPEYMSGQTYVGDMGLTAAR